jgi:hypothetical protein
MRRPPILNPDGKTLSDNVRGIIRDRKGEIVGLLLVCEENSIVYLFAEESIGISYDRKTGELELMKEIYLKNPKEVINRLIR